MTPPRLRAGSSQWSMTGSPKGFKYRSADFISAALATGAPSSETPTTPASANSPRSAKSFPRRPRVTAPITSTRTAPSAAAFRWMKPTTLAESMAGSVLGMQQTVVKPPFAAANVPVATVSLCSKPGSRRWQWRSMKPGQTTRPAASMTSAPSGAVSSGAPAWTTLPSCSSASPTWSSPCDGSSRRPPLMRRGCVAAMLTPLSGPSPGDRARPCAPQRRSPPAPR